MPSYTDKLVKTGPIFTRHTFARPVHWGFPKKKPDTEIEQEDVEEAADEHKPLLGGPLSVRPYVRRQDNANRAQRMVWQLGMCNWPTEKKRGRRVHWVTLTYADPVRAQPFRLPEVLQDFEQFIDRMRYTYGEISYLASCEIQDGKRNKKRGVDKPARNALHFHVLFFDLPTIHNKTMQNHWGLGGTYTVWKHAGHVQASETATYIAKYVSKGAREGIFLKNGKSYLCSQGLKGPSVVRGKHATYLWVRELKALGYKRYKRVDPVSVVDRNTGKLFNLIWLEEWRPGYMKPPWWYGNATQCVAPDHTLQDKTDCLIL